jgi:hypothetical protein
MSSLRPAKIVTSFVRFLGGSLFWPDEAEGPACSCHSCQEAWLRNQARDVPSPRAKMGLDLRQVGPG